MGFTAYQHETRFKALSRDEFLKRQAAYFDRQYSEPRPAAEEILGGVLAMTFSVALYELVAFGIFKLVEKKQRRSRRH